MVVHPPCTRVPHAPLPVPTMPHSSPAPPHRSASAARECHQASFELHNVFMFLTILDRSLLSGTFREINDARAERSVTRVQECSMTYRSPSIRAGFRDLSYFLRYRASTASVTRGISLFVNRGRFWPVLTLFWPVLTLLAVSSLDMPD